MESPNETQFKARFFTINVFLLILSALLLLSSERMQKKIYILNRMDQVAENLKLEFRKAKKVLEDGRAFCLISHRSPDGDAVGANLALRLALESAGKKVVSACVDSIPEDSKYLNNADTFVKDFDYADFDAIVSLDCAAKSLVKFHELKPEIFSGDKPFINFDHHASNDNFGTINPVDPEACATCFILFHFSRFCGWQITRSIATCLLHGIYFDTGSLMHSNTTGAVYIMAGELMAMGANLPAITKNLFHTTEVNKMRLWGRILERAYVNEDEVTVSAVSEADYQACDATSSDTTGAIDFLNAVPGSKYCVLLSEDQKGLVKGSLRTRQEGVDVSRVAAGLGGGGHPRASGFGVKGKLRPVIKWEVVDEHNGEEKKAEF